MLGLFKKSDPAPAAGADAKPADRDGNGSFFNRLRHGLRNTGSKLSGLLGGRRIDDSLFEELEDALISADAGVDTTAALIAKLRQRARKAGLETAEQLRQSLRELLVELLRPLEQPEVPAADSSAPQPYVIMLAGVNGAGKTTSIGKLAKRLQGRGLSVMLAAGDTFRTAAREQLAAWGEKNDVAVISQVSGDPAAVIYDAVLAARARGMDVLLADTAGRLPTQLHLMDEIRKVKRVIAKADPTAPHAVWLVLDANTGQNALSQLKTFDEAIGVTGVILTKLDGTAKGGVVAAIAHARAVRDVQSRPLALSYIGVGEGIDDLRPFNADQFVGALLDGQ